MRIVPKKISIQLCYCGLFAMALFDTRLFAKASLSIKGSVATPVQGIKTFSVLGEKVFFQGDLPDTAFETTIKQTDSVDSVLSDPINRFILPNGMGLNHFGGFLKELDDNRMIVWDNIGLNLKVIKKNSKAVIETKSIAVDLVKPPRDPKGEPTRAEVAILRATFSKNLSKVFGPKISSVRSIKTANQSMNDEVYIVGSRIQKFPVLIMNCRKDDPTSCIADRACYIDEKSKAFHGEIFGVDLNLESDRLVIGDAKHKKIHIFKWKSCFDSRFLYSIDLPKELLIPTALQIDQSNRLWVSSGILDGFTNSSLFYWNKREWQN